MNIQEAINKLESIKKEHGNLEIYYYDLDFEIIPFESIDLGYSCKQYEDCTKDGWCDEYNYCDSDKVVILNFDED